MIYFVGTPTFLRITLRVAMATMHFTWQKQVNFGEQSFAFRGPREQFDKWKNYPGDAS